MSGINMSLERDWFMLYLPINLKQMLLISSVSIRAALVGRGTNAVKPAAYDSSCYRLNPDTRNSLGRHLHPLNSYYEVRLSELRTKANIYLIHFVSKDTTLMKAWERTSILLRVLTCIASIQLLMPRNGCQSPSRYFFSAHAFWMMVKWTVVLYFPLDTYEGRWSTDILNQKLMSTNGRKRSYCTLPMAVAIQ